MNPVTERFSIECRKTKSKAITMTNHNKRKQHNEPMRTRSKYTWPASSAGKRVRRSCDWSWFCIWLVEKVAKVFLKPIIERSTAKPKQFSDYFRHSIANRSKQFCSPVCQPLVLINSIVLYLADNRCESDSGWRSTACGSSWTQWLGHLFVQRVESQQSRGIRGQSLPSNLPVSVVYYLICSKPCFRKPLNSLMGHFPVALCLGFKTSLGAKPFKCVWFEWMNTREKLIFIWKVVHQDSFWNRGKRPIVFA